MTLWTQRNELNELHWAGPQVHSRFLPDPEDDHPGSCPAAPRGPPTQGLTLCHAGTTARPGPPRGLSYPPPPPQAATVSFGDDWSFLPSSAESPLCASSGEPSLVQSEHQAQAGTTEPLPLSSALAPPPPPPPRPAAITQHRPHARCQGLARGPARPAPNLLGWARSTGQRGRCQQGSVRGPDPPMCWPFC